MEMKLLKDILAHISLGASVIASYSFGYDEIGHVGFFVYWLVICSSFLMLNMNESQYEEFCAKNPERKVIRILGVINLTVLIYCNWIVTAIFYLIAWLLLNTKRDKINTDKQ